MEKLPFCKNRPFSAKNAERSSEQTENTIFCCHLEVGGTVDGNLYLSSNSWPSSRARVLTATASRNYATVQPKDLHSHLFTYVTCHIAVSSKPATRGQMRICISLSY